MNKFKRYIYAASAQYIWLIERLQDIVISFPRHWRTMKYEYDLMTPNELAEKQKAMEQWITQSVVDALLRGED